MPPTKKMVLVMDLLVPSWLLCISAAIVLHILVQWKQSLPLVLRDVLEYGKLRKEVSNSVSNWRLGFLSVPKWWFIFFYVWGVIWNCNILYHALIHCVIYPFVQIQGIDQVMRTVTGDYVLFRCYGLTRYHFDALFVLSLICVQVLRRCHECLLVSTFSDSRMSIVHFCLGMFFYSAVGLTALLHLEAGGSIEQQALDHPESIPYIFRKYLQWYHIVALLLFLWASFHQFICHQILADIRIEPSSSKRKSPRIEPSSSKRKSTRNVAQLYGIPKGDWFEYVSSPHLFAEILIYVSMLMCFVFSNWKTPFWLVLISTICTLGLSARQVHTWYIEKFKDYPKKRKILIPWIF